MLPVAARQACRPITARLPEGWPAGSQSERRSSDGACSGERPVRSDGILLLSSVSSSLTSLFSLFLRWPTVLKLARPAPSMRSVWIVKRPFPVRGLDPLRGANRKV